MTSLTIQEIEKINFEDYTDNPSDLFSVAKQLLKIKKFEKGIEVLGKAIELAQNKYGGEEAYECAKFYYNYADALIRKCTDSDDILAVPAEPSKEKSDNKQRNNIDPIIEKQIEDESQLEEEEEQSEDQEKNKEDQAEADTETDEDFAMANLVCAEKIYTKYIDSDPEDNDKLKEAMFALADVYQKFGELQMACSDFQSAAEYFNKAVSTRIQKDSKFSRSIAELYFFLATVYDFDVKKALLNYNKTKLIMEYNLKEELKKLFFTSNSDEIIINETLIEKDEISNEDLFTNKEAIIKISKNSQLMSLDDINELVGITLELYDKLDDALLEVNDNDKYKKEKEKMQDDKNEFQKEFDSSKVIDVSNMIKKRPRNNQADIEEGGKRVKLEKNDENNENDIKISNEN